jgi:hypothetical protein
MTMTSTTVRRGGSINVAYLGASLVLVAGLAAALVVGTSATLALVASPSGFDRTPVGSPAVVNVPAGRVVVYHEGAPGPAFARLGLAVTGPDGAAVPVTPYPGTLQYDTEHGLGTAVAVFDAPTAGTYQVASDGAAGGLLAVGPDLGRDVGDALARAGVLAVAAIAIAGVLVIAGGRRSRA